ncbi:MAG: DUF3221 domain-containing protein [Dehalococcoidales bacterium]|nr:MAG: DUF3221 domain-containing protein [Dehalococcoidales bacterium]
MLKNKSFPITIVFTVLTTAILLSLSLASCNEQPIELQSASEAKDAALSYLESQYSDNTPPEDLIWQEHALTPEGFVGAETVEFVSGEWMLTVSYPVVLPENTVYKVNIINGITGWHWKGNVKADGTVTEVSALNQLSKDDSQNIALDFVKNSPTFVFDGIEETLHLTESLEISLPYTWTFIFRFESAHAGYGDRTGRMLAEVITPHEAAITIEQGEVVYASMDNKWDMMNQIELSDVVDPDDVIIREESDITGTITEIDHINSETVEGRILVELEQPNNTSDKFWVTIKKDTPVYEYDGQDHYSIAFNSLQNGQNVEVWFKGAVMESYPAQVEAEEVLVRLSIDIPPEEPIYFPIQKSANGEQEVMEALLFGELIVTERCLRVKEPEGNTSYLIIWPNGYTYSVEGDEIQIRNSQGNTVFRVGDQVRLSGGEIPVLSAQLIADYIYNGLSNECPGPYWLVGEEVSISNSED